MTGEGQRRAGGRGKGRALPGPGCEQTGVVIGQRGLPFAALTPDAEQARVELLARALVADLLDETRHDGRFPFGTRPTAEGER